MQFLQLLMYPWYSSLHVLYNAFFNFQIPSRSNQDITVQSLVAMKLHHIAELIMVENHYSVLSFVWKQARMHVIGLSCMSHSDFNGNLYGHKTRSMESSLTFIQMLILAHCRSRFTQGWKIYTSPTHLRSMAHWCTLPSFEIQTLYGKVNCCYCNHWGFVMHFMAI